MEGKPLNVPTLTAVFEPAPEGGFTCGFEELPEVFSEGETLAEARANLFDALELVLSYHRDQARRGTAHTAAAGRAAVRETFALRPAAWRQRRPPPLQNPGETPRP